MLRFIMSIVGAAALTACWGAPPNEKILSQLCTDVFAGDAEIAAMLTAESGADLDSFCSCYAATIIAQPEKIDLHKEAVLAIAQVRENSDLGAEDAAQKVGSMIETGEIDGFSEAQLDETGQDFQRVMGSMLDNNGVCPA